MIIKSLTAFFILVIINSSNIFPQLSLRLNLEGGYYNSSSTNFENQKDLTGRADGEINYQLKGEDQAASIKIRARPELYGLRNNLKILKLVANGNYYSTGKNLSWGFSLTGQRNTYNGENINFNYKNANILFESLFKINKDFSMLTNLGYGYQKVSNNLDQGMDIFLINIEALQRLFNNTKLGYGIYLERFLLSGKYLLSDISNKGWQAGPQLTLDYLKSFIINFDYRFLFHFSEITKSPSYEHWIRLVAGKLISEDWSVFFLADYYFRKYTITKQLSNPYIYLYAPTNEDNRIYLKFAYGISDISEIYIKTGYFKENLFNNYSFAGWNVLLGFEIEN
jgi:hypothetical protein